MIKWRWLLLAFSIFIANCLSVSAQKIAIISPEANENTNFVAAKFAENFNSLDPDLVELGLESHQFPNLYNLSTEDSKTLGTALGCDFFILLKSENLRRASLSKPTYFESYAAIYLVSTRTGKLVFWTLKSFEASAPKTANKQLFNSLEKMKDEIAAKIKSTNEIEINEDPMPELMELPDENSPEFKSFQTPLPFKRHVPVYKRLANLYGIAATVDAVVDLDENGGITRIEITRWAGYDLDQSVIEAIRRMQWRPASQNGKRIPIRVLLRYNFKKIDKED